MINYVVMPGNALSGRFAVPGDKSVSHRALMLSAIAEGPSRIKGFLNSLDTLVTMNALKEAGAVIEHRSDDEVAVSGRGKIGFATPGQVLYMGNSGTSARLLAGLFCGLGVGCELTGDASLMLRPMRRIIDPLKQMRASISCSEEGTLPIKIGAKASLMAIDFTMPIASAQLKSGILLASLNAEGKTSVCEPEITRDHTERMLSQFNYPIEKHGKTIMLEGRRVLRGTTIMVPGDISSAVFFIVGACIAEGSNITIENVGINPTRVGAIQILKQMGADISLLDEGERSGEPIADIRVRASELHGIDIDKSLIPSAIDELPAIMIAAACAKGKTRIAGAEELRFKESDRISAMAQGLRTLGINVETYADGIDISGGKIIGGEVHSYGDHRIAMAFTVAGLKAARSIMIKDCANVATSFPNFVTLARQSGISLLVQ